MSFKKRRKTKQYYFCNFMLFLALLSVVIYFLVILFFQKDSNLFISMTGSLLLCIVTILFIFSAIGNPSRKKGNIIATSFFLILYSSFQTITVLDIIPDFKNGYVKDFTGMSLPEVIRWSEANQIDINQVYEYSDMVPEYSIIGQDKDSSTPLENLASLTIVVSEGPNPEKEVIIPDMKGWDADRVVQFLKKNHFSNTQISFISSDQEKDTLIEQNKIGSMKRNDEILLTFSYGKEEDLKEIKLEDLTSMSQFDAEFYLKRNGILFEIEKEFSSKVNRFDVIRTNKKEGDILVPKQEENKVILTISKGEEIQVPDLYQYDTLQITNWVIKNHLKLELIDRYDDTIKKGKVISVNYQKGDKIEQKSLVIVTVSKGKLVMEDFSLITDFRRWADKYSVNYEENYEFSDQVEEGHIIQLSHKIGDTIKNDDTVFVTVSQGEKTKVPSLVGKKKTTVMKRLEKAGLKYKFIYIASSKEKDTCLKQSLLKGSEVSKNVVITVTLSNGKKPTSNTDDDSLEVSTIDPTSSHCDRNRQIEIDLYTGNNGMQTKTMIQTANPNIKFNFHLVSECSNGSSLAGSICNAKELKTANYCDTYNVYIVN